MNESFQHMYYTDDNGLLVTIHIQFLTLYLKLQKRVTLLLVLDVYSSSHRKTGDV